VSISNPFDYHTFIWGNEDAMEATYSAVMRCGFDVTMILMDYPKPGLCDVREWDKATRAYAKAAKKTGARAVMLSSLQEAYPEETRTRLVDNNIISHTGTG